MTARAICGCKTGERCGTCSWTPPRCECRNEYETCPACTLNHPDNTNMSMAGFPGGTARERFEAELEKARARNKTPSVPPSVAKARGFDISDVDTNKGPAGYHERVIERGVYGEASKILEEVHELMDAQEQGARIMELNELADILGATYGYLRKHFADIKFEDLIKMANLNRRAFESGHRTSKDT